MMIMGEYTVSQKMIMTGIHAAVQIILCRQDTPICALMSLKSTYLWSKHAQHISLGRAPRNFVFHFLEVNNKVLRNYIIFKNAKFSVQHYFYSQN
jgi:hypothetical protein